MFLEQIFIFVSIVSFAVLTSSSVKCRRISFAVLVQNSAYLFFDVGVMVVAVFID